MRPSNRTYYYIDYRQTIDYIKWRVYKLSKDMQVPTVPASERKEYVCPRCKADYTQMEVLDSMGPMGFTCQRCGAVLKHEIDRTSAGHEKVTRLNNQMKFITDLLLRIDNVVVPDNTFDFAIQNRLEVERDAQHQVANATVVEPVKPTSVKGLADTGPKHIDIKISASDGPTEEEKEAERLRKEKIAKQNALPTWMANSTVSGDSFSATPTGDLIRKEEPEKKMDSQNKGLDAEQAEELSSYMADLKREKEAMEAAAASKQDDSDEEEEDDFEDVVATPPVSTPIPASQGLKHAPSPLRQSSVPVKREAAVDGTGIAFLKRESPGSDDRPAKKVKVEETADDDDEEDLEFEDV